MNLWCYSTLLVVTLRISMQQNNNNNVCPTFRDYSTIRNNSRCWYDFAANSSLMEIIARNGYYGEAYKVTTLDGYILTVVRIRNKYYTESFINSKEPVFLQHGWLNSGAVFVALGKNSLAFSLADAGHDVWLGNFRGTEYSEQHINLTTFDTQFWDYSADEIGLYDIPSQLELVAKVTNQRGNIVYIGHSLGTAAALIYSSSFPTKAKEMVKLFILLAPAASLTNMKSLFFRIFGNLLGLLLIVASRVPFIRLISQGRPMKTIAQACLESPILMQLCVQLLNFFISGPRSQMDPSLVPVFFNQIPAGTSFKVTKQIADFGRGRFGRFDHGFGNIRRYGRFSAPKFDLSKISIPIFIIYAVGDWICTKEDSLVLYNQLPESVRYGIHEISEPNFNHMDFVFGRNASILVNQPILKVLQRINLSN